MGIFRMEENPKTKNSLIENQSLTDIHFKQLETYGIDLDKIAFQLQLFKTGILKADLSRAATKNDGILVFSTDEMYQFAANFDSVKSNFSIEKFVPASGAASRMFKFLSEFLLDFDREQESINAYINHKNDTLLAAFINGMDKFPFFELVHNRLKQKYTDFESWKRDDKNYFFIQLLLDPTEFDYANKPKGILPFQLYSGKIFTAVEEHLKEASMYAESNGISKTHFTISREHKEEFEKIVSKFDLQNTKVTYSEQHKKTDTIAVDHNNNLLKENNELVLRPGGHGALIYNLNQTDSDIVFIKNIDNVSHKNLNEIAFYKKVLAGYLLEIQKTIFSNLENINKDSVDNNLIKEAQIFIENKLNISFSEGFKDYKKESQIKYINDILNRPIRVCGMVKNENEPGGGPFWVRDIEGNISLQIIESSQIDTLNDNQVQIFKSATHFNPVDIVCGLKNYKGEKFDLLQYVDSNSGFIVDKSKNGINYKAYELPGLWNGAMAKWITIFIEVPLSTFNPVKTVNDLLKTNHQPF